MGRGMIQAFHDLAARAAQQWPERTALIYKSERLSYSDLWSKVEHAAAYFSLMVWFGGLYPRNRHWLIALALVGLGVALD